MGIGTIVLIRRKQEINRIVSTVQAYALIRFGVKISLSVESNTVLQSTGHIPSQADGKKLYENIVALFGGKQGTSLSEVYDANLFQAEVVTPDMDGSDVAEGGGTVTLSREESSTGKAAFRRKRQESLSLKSFIYTILNTERARLEIHFFDCFDRNRGTLVFRWIYFEG